jgi:membrane protease YdiL (CAAX protease family)
VGTPSIPPPLPALDGSATPTPPGRLSPAVWVALLLGVTVVVGPIVAGGELQAFLLTAWQWVPLVILCIAAYVGTERPWGRVVAWLWLAALIVAGILLDGVIGLVRAPFGPDGEPAPGTLRAAGLALGVAVLAALASLATIPLGRRRYPGDVGFVRRLALVALVAFSGLAVVPLLVLGEPPILAILRADRESGIDPSQVRDDAGMLRDTVYAFCWNLPAALFAVGYGVRRSFRAALDRLGLVWPTPGQLVAAVGLSFVLFGASWLLDTALAALWTRLGWPTTDQEAIEALFAFALSLPAAVVVAIVAGVGEEMVVRGVLQPRLGILASNLFFTALHAYQYHWDALLAVFLIGLALGLIRQRTNTSVAALVHAGYDFLAIAALVTGRG